LNARTLDPRERQWPYYLGHLYKDRGDLPRAATFFEEARLLRPDDVATLVWLAEIDFAQGRPDQGEPLLTKALALEPRSVAVLFGLGRLAQARNEHSRAVQHFEAALAVDKTAAAIHYPLAMAYRSLGEQQKAEAHLKQRGAGQILPTDPLMQELGSLLNSTAEYERRGTAALNSGDWATAVAQLRKGVEIAPADPSLRHRLGTALFQMGDAGGAVEQFEQALRTSPNFARAHYSLGLLEEAQGRRGEAMERFRAALAADPGYVEARLALAGVMRRSGRAQDSTEHYQRVLEIEPRSADAAFGYAMAHVGLGRYGDARDLFARGMASFPDHTGFPHALARVLAAAPDDRVRDGPRAATLVEGLLERHQTLELGESMAMALAELGRYDEAATLQRDVIASAKGSGREGLAGRMAENLRAYERRQPCRRPWRDGELP
jgi:tetratricopeptide (TPR) repeat protein